MLAVVAGDGAVRRLGLHRLAVRRHQHAGHQAERAEALRDGVGLHVAVVVLARPHVAAFPLHRGGDHVVDQAMLVGEAAASISALNSVWKTSSKMSLNAPSYALRIVFFVLR